MLAAKGQRFAEAHHSPPARNGAAATMIGILVNPEFPDTLNRIESRCRRPQALVATVLLRMRLMRSMAMPRRSHQTESFEIVGADGKRQPAFVEQLLEGPCRFRAAE